jgi:hypothetical protein
MARGTRSVGQGLQFALPILFLLLELANLKEFLDGCVDMTCFAENADFLKANLYRLSEIADSFELCGFRISKRRIINIQKAYQSICLSYLIWCLF